MDINPPLRETLDSLVLTSPAKTLDHDDQNLLIDMVDQYELPLIDLSHLNLGPQEKDKCVEDMVDAATKWGFFQIVNHGIPQEMLEMVKNEETKVFHQDFVKKAEDNFMNLSTNSYQWGNPAATLASRFLWSESFHISVSEISKIKGNDSLRFILEEYTKWVADLAERIALILSRSLGLKSCFFEENCPSGSSYLRLNRYPRCPVSSKVYGFIPHTDSDILTIVYQDDVGGLQLMKDGRWVSIKPNPSALIVNMGDLFEALSNGVYKSIRHRVLAPPDVERLSLAYFYCPTFDAVIESCTTTEPRKYKKFSFGEYKHQIGKDVRATGDKVGLSRFLLQQI